MRQSKMKWFIDNIYDKLEIAIAVALAALLLIALIRIIIRIVKGEDVSITPVGISNDLPGSVTGMNKNYDLHERSREASDIKTNDE